MWGGCHAGILCGVDVMLGYSKWGGCHARIL